MREDRKRVIDLILVTLIPKLGGIWPVVPVTDTVLNGLYRANDWAGMVRTIRDRMGLRTKILLGIATNDLQGPRGAAAWIENDTSSAENTTHTFGLRVRMFIRKSFLEKAPFATVVFAIAHELSHIVVDKTSGHPYKGCEEAVDLTAMILGYRTFYLAGHRYTPRISLWKKTIMILYNTLLALFSGIYAEEEYMRAESRNVGYLTDEEIAHVDSLLSLKAAT